MEKLLKRHPHYGIIYFILLLALFLFLRCLHIDQSIGFASDAGRDFLTAWNIYTQHKLTLIGPSSEFTVNGHQFFFGPFPFYEILPALILGKGSIIFVSYYLIGINAMGIFLTLFILYRSIKNKLIVFIFGYLLTITPLIVENTRSYWNPYPMIVISTLLIGLLSIIYYKKKSKNTSLLFFIIGLLYGLGLQCHYSYILVIILSIVVLGFMKKINKKNLLMIVLGGLVGFSPIILFELRNHFYNTQTLLLAIQQGEIFGSSSSLHQFYFIPLLPFFFFLVAIIIAKFLKNKAISIIFAAFLLMYTCFSFMHILPVPSKGYTMVEGWNVPGLEKTAAIIESQQPKQFNIFDQLTDDNRAMALRYILTADNQAPMAIDQYPKATTLFVYTRESVSEILNLNVWEIHSAMPMHVVKTWPIQNNIYLYELQKTNQ